MSNYALILLRKVLTPTPFKGKIVTCFQLNLMQSFAKMYSFRFKWLKSSWCKANKVPAIIMPACLPWPLMTLTDLLTFFSIFIPSIVCLMSSYISNCSLSLFPFSLPPSSLLFIFSPDLFSLSLPLLSSLDLFLPLPPATLSFSSSLSSLSKSYLINLIPPPPSKKNSFLFSYLLPQQCYFIKILIIFDCLNVFLCPYPPPLFPDFVFLFHTPSLSPDLFFIFRSALSFFPLLFPDLLLLPLFSSTSLISNQFNPPPPKKKNYFLFSYPHPSPNSVSSSINIFIIFYCLKFFLGGGNVQFSPILIAWKLLKLI